MILNGTASNRQKRDPQKGNLRLSGVQQCILDEDFFT